MFNKLRKQAKKERIEMEARETACDHEVRRVLKEFNCVLEPVLQADNHGIYARAQITALPPQDDKRPEQPAKPAEPAAGTAPAAEEASIRGQEKADELAQRNGAPVDPSKVTQ
jgi:hypothetical protein